MTYRNASRIVSFLFLSLSLSSLAWSKETARTTEFDVVDILSQPEPTLEEALMNEAAAAATADARAAFPTGQRASDYNFIVCHSGRFEGQRFARVGHEGWPAIQELMWNPLRPDTASDRVPAVVHHTHVQNGRGEFRWGETYHYVRLPGPLGAETHGAVTNGPLGYIEISHNKDRSVAATLERVKEFPEPDGKDRSQGGGFKDFLIEGNRVLYTFEGHKPRGQITIAQPMTVEAARLLRQHFFERKGEPLDIPGTHLEAFSQQTGKHCDYIRGKSSHGDYYCVANNTVEDYVRGPKHVASVSAMSWKPSQLPRLMFNGTQFGDCSVALHLNHTSRGHADDRLVLVVAPDKRTSMYQSPQGPVEWLHALALEFRAGPNHFRIPSNSIVHGFSVPSRQRRFPRKEQGLGYVRVDSNGKVHRGGWSVRQSRIAPFVEARTIRH